MPVYEYECECCQFRFEEKQGFHDEPIATCPRCQGRVHRVLHPPPIIFKGNGFYVTDNRKGGDTELEHAKEKVPEKSPSSEETKKE